MSSNETHQTVEPQTRRRGFRSNFNRRLPFALALAFSLIAISYGHFSRQAARVRTIPIPFVQMSAPVVVEIAWRPQIKPVDQTNIRKMEGPAEFIFTNCTDDAIKVAFPPLRHFSFSESGFSRDVTLPEFARESRVHEIPAGESIRFKDSYGVLTQGDSILRGGPGFIGFVFSRPADAKTDDGYLVGTIFPWYSVYSDDGSTDNMAMEREAKFNLGIAKGGRGKTSAPESRDSEE